MNSSCNFIVIWPYTYPP